MKHLWLKRAVCLLLAGQCALSIPASTMIEAAAIEEYNAVAAEEDVFGFDGMSPVEEATESSTDQEDTSTDKEIVISYVDIEGNYNAPEELTVYITSRAEEGKVETPAAESKYTGVVAFYDYNEDRARENPYFFYYEEGELRQEELQFAAAQSYLDLVNPPVSESVITGVAPAADEAEEKVYAAEEVYVDEEAQEHREYLFAFNQEEADNGLYTGEKDGQVYESGLLTVAEGEDPEGTEEEQPTVEEKIQRAVPVTTIAKKAGGIQVSWTKDETATGYRILRKASDESEWAVVADLDGGDQSSYLDETAVSDKTYTYAVRSYFGDKTGAEREEETSNLWSGYQESSAVYYLAAPKLTAVYDDASGLTVTWSGVLGATNYWVCRKELGGSWKTLATVSSTTLTYNDKTVEDGVQYLYTVRALKNSVLGTYYDYTNDISRYVARHAVPTVTVSAATQGTKGGILVKWTADTTATGYRVFRRSAASSQWAIVANVGKETTSCLDAGVTSNENYTYAVRAYYGEQPVAEAKGYTSGDWSYFKVSSSLSYLAAPTLSSVNSAVSGMTVVWNAVSGAESYRVYRKEPGGTWTTLASVTGTSYTDKTVQNGTEYIYTVRALKGGTISAYFNPAEGYVYHAPLKVYVANSSLNDGSVQLGWAKAQKATGYRIYRMASGESSWSRVADLKAEDFASASMVVYYDSNVSHGKTYTYAVRTYYGSQDVASALVDSSNNWSHFNSVQIAYSAPPALNGCISAAAGMTVKWTTVSGATSYTIYRKTATSNWITLKTVAGEQSSSYTDATAVNGTAYYYTVRATVNGTLSGYLTPEESYIFHAAPQVTLANSDTGMAVGWTTDATATGYRVFRKLSTETNWTVIANVTGSMHIDTSLGAGKTASYAVRAYYGTAGVAEEKSYDNNVWSGFVANSGTRLLAPTITSKAASNVATGIKITWEKVVGATGYTVWRMDMSAQTPKWTQIATLNGGSVVSYIDTNGLNTNRIYYYTVRAIAGDGSVSRFDKIGAVAKYLPQPEDLAAGMPASSGTQITWSAVPGATSYSVYRRTSSGSWTRIGTAASTSYTDTTVTNKNTRYYYTVFAVAAVAVEGSVLNITGAYDNVGVTFAVKWSGSERNTWVLKDGKQYYIDKNGYCLTGWQYIKRYGTEYKYYFDMETGELCTNLYQKFGSSYADMKCKYVVNINSSNSNPSTVTILLYDSEKGTYNTPAVSARCIGSLVETMQEGVIVGSKTKTGTFYIKKGRASRWLNSSAGCYEQYCVFARGSSSWFHSSIYSSENYKKFNSSTYNALVNNSNTTWGCIRLQCIYNYLLCDIQLNGYGATSNVTVQIYHQRSAKPPFGIAGVDKIGKRSTEPTDPAVTGKFFYKTSIFGVSATAGAKTWMYYKSI